MTGHEVCHGSPTVSYFHLVKGTWLVELAQYTNSKDEMVQNTKSSHMSWGRDARKGITAFGSGPGATAHVLTECGQEKHVSVSSALVPHR